MTLTDVWGTADFSLIKVDGLSDWARHTVSDITMSGEIRGVWHEKTVRFVCSKNINTYDELSEEITGNCLYPWVMGIISQQDAELDGVAL